MIKPEQLKIIAKELIEQANLDIIESEFSTDYIAHSGKKDYKGHNFLKLWTKQIHSAIQNIRLVDILILAQDEQTITWQRILTGKHISDLKGIPASNKKVTWTEMIVSRFNKNKIIEEWVVSELAGELMIKQEK